MKKALYSNTLKIVLSATIAIIIAYELELQFGVTAGVISILSIQNTKKESLLIAGKRIVAVSVAILLSFVLYLLLGNSPIIFGLFLLIFIPFTKKFGLQDGMVVGSVLSTHLLSSTNINVDWVINEFGLTFIGVGIALIFNLFTPSLEEKFGKNKILIEEGYREILSSMSDSLLTHAVPVNEKKTLDRVEELIRESKDLALQINNNYLLKGNRKYIEYIDMRIMQMDTLKRMKKHFSRFNMTYEQTKILSQFTKDIAENLREDNDCVLLIDKMDYIRKEYKKMDLPKSRDEFENRALLFQYLNDIEEFLILKREYYLSRK